MRKVFKLQDEKKKPERIIEAMKNEIRKYLKRERKKKLSDTSTMFWDFDCKFGKDKESSKVVEVKDLIKSLDIILEENWEECYVEILAKEVSKPIKEEIIIEEDSIE
ncbi:hypothetical protein MNB_SV-15-1166 [hydrothermal vent metagenome]|uniref:Uncharacterized protein n=1 Tax=hydrothermal vent metagenome TaxID=652676 RepID=A0A1W1EHV0_9ZZZZ